MNRGDRLQYGGLDGPLNKQQVDNNNNSANNSFVNYIQNQQQRAVNDGQSALNYAEFCEAGNNQSAPDNARLNNQQSDHMDKNSPDEFHAQNMQVASDSNTSYVPAGKIVYMKETVKGKDPSSNEIKNSEAFMQAQQKLQKNSSISTNQEKGGKKGFRQVQKQGQPVG